MALTQAQRCLTLLGTVLFLAVQTVAICHVVEHIDSTHTHQADHTHSADYTAHNHHWLASIYRDKHTNAMSVIESKLDDVMEDCIECTTMILDELGDPVTAVTFATPDYRDVASIESAAGSSAKVTPVSEIKPLSAAPPVC